MPDAVQAAQAELARLAALGFAWGHRDCGTAAGAVVLAASGIDPCSEFRGRYSTELGCARVLKRIFGTHNPAQIVEILADRHGWPDATDWRVCLAVDVNFRLSSGGAVCPAIIGIDGVFTVFSPDHGARSVSPANIAVTFKVV
jgi:hypothetical protein